MIRRCMKVKLAKCCLGKHGVLAKAAALRLKGFDGAIGAIRELVLVVACTTTNVGEMSLQWVMDDGDDVAMIMMRQVHSTAH